MVSKDSEYSPTEARKRFEAALKGARIAGHKPKESLTRKKSKTPHKKAKKKSK